MAFRPSAETRALIEQAAVAADHSIATEIDRRLMLSFWKEDALRSTQHAAFGGEHNLALAFLIARLAVAVEHECKMKWTDDESVWREVASAIVAFLQLFSGFEGGTAPLPIHAGGGHANPAWDVDTYSRRKGDLDKPIYGMMPLLLAAAVNGGSWPLTAVFGEEHESISGSVPTLKIMRELFGVRGQSPKQPRVRRRV